MTHKLDFVDECYKDKDLSLLKKLTLVIPTYNRNYYLSRCLWYHAHFPFGQIIVADSSPEEKKVVNRETVAKIREMFDANVLYLEYQPETEKYGGDIYRKWGDAVQHVETEYDVICTDKEFLIPTTSVECIRYLDEHLDYDIIDARYSLLTITSKYKYGFKERYPEKSKSIDCDTTFERLLIFSLNEHDTYNLLSLRRTKKHQYLYDKLSEYGINDLRFGELLLEMLSIISSKYKHINNNDFKCRDISELVRTKSKSESSAQRYDTLECYVANGIYDDLMNKSVLLLTDEIKKNSNLSENQMKQLNELCYSVFYAFQKHRGFFKSTSDIRVMLSKLPIFIINMGRKILNVPEKYIDELSKELTILQIIVNETNSCHKKDSVIYYLN